MTGRRYQLCAHDGRMPLSEDGLRALGLAPGVSIGERELRSRADRLPSRSLREALHAMLDQEQPGVELVVRPWPEEEV